jgi:hypothetical protein
VSEADTQDAISIDVCPTILGSLSNSRRAAGVHADTLLKRNLLMCAMRNTLQKPRLPALCIACFCVADRYTYWITV